MFIMRYFKTYLFNYFTNVDSQLYIILVNYLIESHVILEITFVGIRKATFLSFDFPLICADSFFNMKNWKISVRTSLLL